MFTSSHFNVIAVKCLCSILPQHGTAQSNTIASSTTKKRGPLLLRYYLMSVSDFLGKGNLENKCTDTRSNNRTNQRTNGTLMFTLFLATSSGKAERNEERLEEDKTVCVCGCSGLAATRQQRAEQPHKTHHEAAIHFETPTHNF